MSLRMTSRIGLAQRFTRREWCAGFLSLSAIVIVTFALSAVAPTRSAYAQDSSPEVKAKAPFSELRVKLLIPALVFPELNLTKGPDTAEKHFAVENLGTEALSVTVGSPSTSDFSVVAGAGTTTLDAKQSETVTVEFAPSAAGSFKDEIAISSNATEGKADATVKLKGTTGSTGRQIFVPNNFSDSVTAYPVNRTGNIAPVININGDNPLLANPMGIAVDSKGNIYVANSTGGASDNGSVTVYAAEAKGDASPIATISGPDTGLYQPEGIAVDADGNIYVANFWSGPIGLGNGSITVYPMGSNGDISPSVTITNTAEAAGMVNPIGIAVDQVSGNIFVTSAFFNVVEYVADSSGDATPIAIIAGSHTGLGEDRGIALNPVNGDIYVVNELGSVMVYAAGSSGNVSPTAVIEGPVTRLDLPSGIALDASGTIYVTNPTPIGDKQGTITVYPAGSKGNHAPSARIEGAATELSLPYGIAVGP
jgi:hypothetical protein